MSKLIYKYGNGKSTDLCQTDYNFKEQGAKTIVMNALNDETIVSKFEGDIKLIREVDAKLNDDLFEFMINCKKNGISNIFVDSAHLLTEDQVFSLFIGSKALDIEVQLYGDRLYNGNLTSGTKRALELADDIEKINGIINDSHRSNIQFYYGAMNSSKSAKLLIKAKELEVKGLKVFTIKPRLDREELYIKSRIGISRKADLVIDDDRLYTYGGFLHDCGFNYVFVDECQFLTEKQIIDLYNINKDYNIPIECYGLKADFMTKTFPGSKKLLVLADDLIKLKTICNCENHPEAIFNARKDKFGNFVRNGEQIVIDSGNYLSICAKCYIEKVMGLNLNDSKKLVKELKKFN